MMQAYELAYSTYTSNGGYNDKGERIKYWYDLTKLDATQRELVRWIENETG